MLDFDATPIDVPFGEGAGGRALQGRVRLSTRCWSSCGREVLAGILRPGNAGANNADDHLAGCSTWRWSSCPERARRRDPRARSIPPAPATTSRSPAARPTSASRWATRSPSPSARRCSALPQRAWQPAVDQDGQPREGAWVAELTDRSTWASWPQGTRLICRRERPAPRRAAVLHRPRRAPLSVLHHRPAADDLAALEVLPPPARPGRGPRQDAQGDRRLHLPFHAFAAKRRVAGARALRPRRHRLDAAAHARRRAPHLRAQAAALPDPARRRPPHPPRPPQHPAPPRRLALGRRDPARVQAPRGAPRLRLTPATDPLNRTRLAHRPRPPNAAPIRLPPTAHDTSPELRATRPRTPNRHSPTTHTRHVTADHQARVTDESRLGRELDPDRARGGVHRPGRLPPADIARAVSGSWRGAHCRRVGQPASGPIGRTGMGRRA